jgi:hypothetical protein
MYLELLWQKETSQTTKYGANYGAKHGAKPKVLCASFSTKHARMATTSSTGLATWAEHEICLMMTIMRIGF